VQAGSKKLPSMGIAQPLKR